MVAALIVDPDGNVRDYRSVYDDDVPREDTVLDEHGEEVTTPTVDELLRGLDDPS